MVMLVNGGSPWNHMISKMKWKIESVYSHSLLSSVLLHETDDDI